MSNFRSLSFVALLCTVACSGSDGSSNGTAGPSSTADTTTPALPAGEKQLTLTLAPFDIGPGEETYRCQTFQNPFGQDIAIVKSESTMTPGSHHMAAFRVMDDTNGAIEECSGLEFHPTIHASQTPTATTVYPPGIGASLSAAEGVRLNVHFLNTTLDTIHTHVTVTFTYVNPSDVTYQAAQIYLNNSSLQVPPGASTATATLAIPTSVGDVKLLSAQSHMHQRATHFDATLSDGTDLYQTAQWSEPEVKTFTPALALPSGSSITWTCDFQNNTTETLTFGESAATNEMCVFTGFYYPAPAGAVIVGDTSLGAAATTLDN